MWKNMYACIRTHAQSWFLMTGPDILHPLFGEKVVGKPRRAWILAKGSSIRVWKSNTRLLCQPLSPPPLHFWAMHILREMWPWVWNWFTRKSSACLLRDTWWLRKPPQLVSVSLAFEKGGCNRKGNDTKPQQIKRGVREQRSSSLRAQPSPERDIPDLPLLLVYGTWCCLC